MQGGSTPTSGWSAVGPSELATYAARFGTAHPQERVPHAHGQGPDSAGNGNGWGSRGGLAVERGDGRRRAGLTDLQVAALAQQLGIQLKYTEPPERALPTRTWRLYEFQVLHHASEQALEPAEEGTVLTAVALRPCP